MTTIPGHNQIIQNAGSAQEISNQAQSPKPSPDVAAAVQQAQEAVQRSSVQGSEESERLKRKRREQAQKDREKRKQAPGKEELAPDPDTTGRLLDTII